MTGLVTYDLNDESVEALGHPSDCTEPAPGTVSGSASHSITVTNAAGESKGFAIVSDSPSFEIPTHSHDYSDPEGCHDDASHSIGTGSMDTSKFSSSVTINGSPVMVVNDAYATDPKSGGNVNVVGTGINNSITESEA